MFYTLIILSLFRLGHSVILTTKGETFAWTDYLITNYLAQSSISLSGVPPMANYQTVEDIAPRKVRVCFNITPVDNIFTQVQQML